MAPTAPPPRGRPDLTLGLRAGLAFGGDTLATATVSDGSDQSLDAGSGFLLSLGAMATPLWLTDQVGVGAGIELGLRYNSIGASNGSIVLHSYPVVVLAQMTMRVGDRLYVVPQVGLVKELGVNLSGSGIADGLAVDLTSSVGPVVGLGLLWCFSPHLAFDVTVRYQHLDYSRGDAKADASGVLLTATGHFLP